MEKDFDKSENDLKALQSVGQIIGEVLKQLDDERCEYLIGLFTLLLAFIHLTINQSINSHCQGFFRTSICRGMQKQGAKR